jgi:CubicO group peptidase (beta-lactamase class C family)
MLLCGPRRNCVLSLALCSVLLFPLQAAEIGTAAPAAVGFSPERLSRLKPALEQTVNDHQFAGMVYLLARHGKIVQANVCGKKDLAAGTPLTRDAIFRIFSMTKPITAVAMMLLYEEGKWNPDEPLSKYIPEFKSLKVMKESDAKNGMVVEDPVHAPTVGELMTHTAGFTYGFFGDTPVDHMYRDKQVMGSNSLDEFIQKLSSIPLLYQPGTRWVYSASVDIQGYLVEKLSGKPLPEFIKERIFDPLGMKDTGFYVPAGKMSRFVTLYSMNDNNELAVAHAGGDYAKPPSMPSGGGGLTSTADDYMRFAQMLANGGELNGVRILAPSSVKLMTSNHLADRLMTGEFGIGAQHIRPGFGYGYDVAVFTNPPLAGSTAGKGTFLWDGAAGTWFWIDPTNDIVFVGMVQRMLDARTPNVEHLSRALTFQALVDPSK